MVKLVLAPVLALAALFTSLTHADAPPTGGRPPMADDFTKGTLCTETEFDAYGIWDFKTDGTATLDAIQEGAKAWTIRYTSWQVMTNGDLQLEANPDDCNCSDDPFQVVYYPATDRFYLPNEIDQGQQWWHRCGAGE